MTRALLPIVAGLFLTSACNAGAREPNSQVGEPISNCRVVDGDTLRCGPERIRLLGIDAPELPGHCRAGRTCAPGDPYASTESLRRAMTGMLLIQRVTQDRYGRTVALVSGDRGDLSCWQLRAGAAVYKPKWDNGRLLARSCREAR